MHPSWPQLKEHLHPKIWNEFVSRDIWFEIQKVLAKKWVWNYDEDDDIDLNVCTTWRQVLSAFETHTDKVWDEKWEVDMEWKLD